MGRLDESTPESHFFAPPQTRTGQQPEEYQVTRAGESSLDVVHPARNRPNEPSAPPPQPTQAAQFPPRGGGTWATRSTIPSNNSPQATPSPDLYPPEKSPQAFPPPEAYPPKKQPQAFPPPEAYPPEKPPQAFPPSQDYDQVHAYPPQGGPVTFPPQQQQVYGNPNMASFTPAATNFSYPAQNGNLGFGSQGNPGGSPFGNNNNAHMMIPPQGIPLSVPTNAWNTQLFDCMDDPENALITACFPCITFGQIAEIIDQGRTPCMTSGILYGVIAFCIAAPCLISCGYRTKIRNSFGLDESPGPDWLVHCFCEWCALCQEYRELKNRGIDPAIGWQANSMRAQVPMATMTPPMNPMMNR